MARPDRVRLTRTLVYEGTGTWIAEILKLNVLGPDRSVWPQPFGTITETESRLDVLPEPEERNREPKSNAASPARPTGGNTRTTASTGARKPKRRATHRATSKSGVASRDWDSSGIDWTAARAAQNTARRKPTRKRR